MMITAAVIIIVIAALGYLFRKNLGEIVGVLFASTGCLVYLLIAMGPTIFLCWVAWHFIHKYW